MSKRILSIDPSGTGTTGVYYRNGEQESFHQFTDKEWVKHCWFILDLVRDWQPDFLLFENSNYVSLRGKDMTSLWKLLGAIEVLPYGFLGLHSIAVPVNQVKGLRGKLLKREKTIAGISYQPGKGWHYSGKKISTHELDAYLVYWLWQSKAENKQKNELIGKSIAGNKIKAKTKQKDYETEIDNEEDEIVGGYWPPGGGSGCILMECKSCGAEYPQSMGHECMEFPEDETIYCPEPPEEEPETEEIEND